MANKTIKFFMPNGVLKNEIPFDSNSILRTLGMLVRCHLKDGREVVGYSNAGIPDEYITMFDDIEIFSYNTPDDKEVIKVNMSDIESIDAMLYSSPRWGNKLPNKFEFK